MAFLTRRETPRPPMENLELLRTAANEVELSMIRGLLDENSIPYVTRERDGASYLRVMAGYTMFGVDVYVDRNDLDRAGELLGVYLSGNAGNAEDTETESTEDDEPAEAEADEELAAEAESAESAPEEPSTWRRLVPVAVAILLILIAAFAVSRV